eukprot:TRINITY_DN8303_c0_g1_i3.p1 TRINITY_DN8303_c0_g1~~TRINITY_DN8303_c0_g1_i3.p1  ORF type:complete len:262 (-),score=-17.98 TRINITY_DN8303_c0_g1_i3:336-1121(-)
MSVNTVLNMRSTRNIKRLIIYSLHLDLKKGNKLSTLNKISTKTLKRGSKENYLTPNKIEKHTNNSLQEVAGSQHGKVLPIFTAISQTLDQTITKPNISCRELALIQIQIVEEQNSIIGRAQTRKARNPKTNSGREQSKIRLLSDKHRCLLLSLLKVSTLRKYIHIIESTRRTNLNYLNQCSSQCLNDCQGLSQSRCDLASKERTAKCPRAQTFFLNVLRPTNFPAQSNQSSQYDLIFKPSQNQTLIMLLLLRSLRIKVLYP